MHWAALVDGVTMAKQQPNRQLLQAGFQAQAGRHCKVFNGVGPAQTRAWGLRGRVAKYGEVWALKNLFKGRGTAVYLC